MYWPEQIGSEKSMRSNRNVAQLRPAISLCTCFADAILVGVQCPVSISRNLLYFPSLAIRWVSRDTLRLADFLWTMPVRAARMSVGSAATRAAVAATLLPLAMASSTWRNDVRMRERRAL